MRSRGIGDRLQMKLRVFPIGPAALTISGGTAKVDQGILAFRQPDVVPRKKVLAFRTKAHLAKRPPLFEGIRLLKEF